MTNVTVLRNLAVLPEPHRVKRRLRSDVDLENLLNFSWQPSWGSVPNPTRHWILDAQTSRPLTVATNDTVSQGNSVAALRVVLDSIADLQDNDACAALVALRTFSDNSPTAVFPLPAEGFAALWFAARGTHGARWAINGISLDVNPTPTFEMLAQHLAKGLQLPKDRTELQLISASEDESILRREVELLQNLAPGTELLQLACRTGAAGPALGLWALGCALESRTDSLVFANDTTGGSYLWLTQEAVA